MNEVINIVFQLARHGLTEIAKNTQNSPATVAQAANALASWQAETEAQLSKASTATPADKPAP